MSKFNPFRILVILNVLFITSTSFLVTRFFWKSDKIAYVDSSKILSEFKGAEEAKKSFGTKAKTWQSNIDSLTTEVQNSIKKYEKDLATMSSKEQNLSKQLLGNKQKQLGDYQNAIRENAKQEDAKLTQDVVAKINAYLTKYGEQKNYKIILIANQSGTIAYAEKELDITKDVIDGLNNEYTISKK
nr:OmpH family outer membrane protein [Pedobacter sp. ASV2]